MSTITNSENLLQYQNILYLILEQILTNWQEKLEYVSKLQTNCMAMFHLIENSHSDKIQIHCIVKL